MWLRPKNAAQRKNTTHREWKLLVHALFLMSRQKIKEGTKNIFAF